MNIFEDTLSKATITGVTEGRQKTIQQGKSIQSAKQSGSIQPRKPLAAVAVNTHTFTDQTKQIAPSKKLNEGRNATKPTTLSVVTPQQTGGAPKTEKKFPQKRKAEIDEGDETSTQLKERTTHETTRTAKKLKLQNTHSMNETTRGANHHHQHDDFEYRDNTFYEQNGGDDEGDDGMDEKSGAPKSLIEASILNEIAAQSRLLKEESKQAEEIKRVTKMDAKSLSEELAELQQNYESNRVEFERKKQRITERHQRLVDEFTSLHFSESDRIQSEYEDEKSVILNEISALKKKIIRDSLAFRQKQKRKNMKIIKLTAKIDKINRRNMKFEKALQLQADSVCHPSFFSYYLRYSYFFNYNYYYLLLELKIII